MAQMALVTGASSGIGYELAKQLGAKGYNLVVVARRVEPLNRLKSDLESQYGITVVVMPKDLSQPQACDEIFQALQQGAYAIDVLVNNAGFSDYGWFAEAPIAKITEMLQVNVLALTQLTQLFLPGMIARGQGRILNVASIVGFQPGPLMAAYAASKAYVLSFSEALANEVRGKGVTVTALCPGLTESGFSEKAGLANSRLGQWKNLPTAAAVAQFGVEAMERGQTIALHQIKHRVWVNTWLRMLPRSWVTEYVRWEQGFVE